jgi:hypothetical protein
MNTQLINQFELAAVQMVSSDTTGPRTLVTDAFARAAVCHCLQIKIVEGKWPRTLKLTYTWNDSADPNTLHESALVLFTTQRVYVFEALVAALRDAAKERDMNDIREETSPVVVD